MSYTQRYYQDNAEPLLPVALRCACAKCRAEDGGEREGDPGKLEAASIELANAASDASGPKVLDNSKAAQVRAQQTEQAAEEIAAASTTSGDAAVSDTAGAAAEAIAPAAPAAEEIAAASTTPGGAAVSDTAGAAAEAIAPAAPADVEVKP